MGTVGQPSSDCDYVVPSAAGSEYPHQVDALKQNGIVVDPVASEIQVNADLEMTSCYRGTDTCISDVSQYGMSGTDTYGDIDTRLVIFQTDANGSESACGAAQADMTGGR